LVEQFSRSSIPTVSIHLRGLLVPRSEFFVVRRNGEISGKVSVLGDGASDQSASIDASFSEGIEGAKDGMRYLR
jgi:hypothetical protein